MAMEKTCLIINTGSASRKYALYRGAREILAAYYEEADGGFAVTLASARGKRRTRIAKKEFLGAFAHFCRTLSADGVIKNAPDVDAIGIRIVAPGIYFQKHRIVDGAYLRELKDKEQNAPLHIAPALADIKSAKAAFPAAPIVGVSDSAFHAALPEEAYRYAIPEHVADEHEIRRFGYHGISLQSAVEHIKKAKKKLPARTIVCHLGGGSSVTALFHGESVETSMGFTPLAGVPMATRSGSIDPGAVLYLAEVLRFDPKTLRTYLNEGSGLLGVSGKSADLRDLLAAQEAGEHEPRIAVEMYVRAIKKHIGAYAAVLGGVDMLVFSGTIGLRSAPIRGRVCEGMGHLGIALDEKKNERAAETGGSVERVGERVRILVIPTDEMAVIAKETRKSARFTGKT